MRFEKIVWTLLALFIVGGSGVETDMVVGGVDTRGQYQAADGEQKVPPPVMDPGSTTTVAAQFTK
jgi:hypothetical protein